MRVRTVLVALVLASLSSGDFSAGAQQQKEPAAETGTSGRLPRPRIVLSRQERSYRLTGLPAVALMLVLVAVPGVLLARWITVRRDAKISRRALADAEARLHASYAADRQAQEVLAQSEKRYRLLFQNNPAPMWIYDRGSLKILEVNEAAIAHYGYSREEFSRMSILALREAEEQQRLIEYLESDPSDGLAFFETNHIRKDGSLIAVEVRSHSMEIPDRDARLVLITDITERKQLQERLLQSQKMEAIGQLAGGIAHDFNNLLTVVTGLTGMLMSDLEADHPSRSDVRAIQAAADRATELTRQLLAFSRRQMLQPRVIDLNLLITDIGRMLGRLLPEDIEVTTNLAPGLWNVCADPNQIEQVIVNLVVNSRDAMPSGGRIRIATENVILDEDYAHLHAGAKPGEYVVLATEDNGAGMTPEVRSRVFEPFFTTKPKEMGTGLGLATVYGTVKQTGGYIWVYSEPGRGTTVKIYLPRDDRPADAAPAANHSGQPTGAESGTILVAEDEPLVRKAVCRILERYGYDLIEAENGQAALEIIDSYTGQIDLVISDLVMPVMGGQEVAAELKLRSPDIPILLMSGYNEDTAAGRAGIDAHALFLNKPFTPESLIRKVRDALGRV